jgi:2-polyprenyl-6-methoxyphenol hydroxylase-like FAD-dependent oxidoreductase
MTALDSNESGVRDAQVVIVGGGPVGLGLAIELGQRGVRTLLVERLLEPSPIPRGQNLTQRTMEHFHFCSNTVKIWIRRCPQH